MTEPYGVLGCRCTYDQEYEGGWGPVVWYPMADCPHATPSAEAC
jgi:hypothetical protein